MSTAVEKLSIVVPVYKNEESLGRLLHALGELSTACPLPVEVVFVVDGSPDRSAEMLRSGLAQAAFSSRLVMLSRNFGSFNAIRAGLEIASGDYMAVVAADLQEPPELALRFLELMQRGEADITFGLRTKRTDPVLDELASNVFWRVYRRYVLPELPAGGVDMFGCTRTVRDRLNSLRESNANLIALLFWLGFRRAYVPYERQPRKEGKSAWTLGKKIRYAVDSVFNFTDLPIRFLLALGGVGTVIALVFAIVLFVARLTGKIPVPGYTATAVLITFFGSILSLGLGILGEYVWLVLQNVRGRPASIIERVEDFPEPGRP
jgi:glycosyltransferase involved in cell wall biosynthesis